MDSAALLKPEEFDTHVANRTLRLSFVGMSNCGKSYRAKVLERECDFLWYQVDRDIAQRLGVKDVEGIAKWMRYPTTEGYSEREQKYLELENEFTGQAAMSAHGQNLVFDTTGSVIHISPATLQNLRDNTLVVHLDVGENSLDDLLRRFFKDPKPVAWSGFFNQHPGESEEAALRRSYPELLAERLRKYRMFAHLNIDSRDVWDKTGVETLAIIRNKLACYSSPNGAVSSVGRALP